VVVTARVDLDDLHDPGTLPALMQAIRRSFATGVLAVAYSDTVARTELAALPLGPTADDSGLELLCGLFVSNGHWQLLDPTADRDQRRLELAETAIPAAATFAGLTVLPNRQVLEEMFAALPDRREVALEIERQRGDELSATACPSSTADTPATADALLVAHAAAQAGQMPTLEKVARFGVALRNSELRDAMWWAIDEERLVGIDLWVNLARRLPAPFDAAPLFLAAWSAYRAGNGAIAGIAAGLALDADPDYGAARLLLAALAHGVAPGSLRRLHPPIADVPQTVSADPA
jgi:hypothetical protein